MAKMSYPGEREDNSNERQKALNLIKKLKKLEKKGYFEKVENGIQNLHRFKRYE